MQIKLTQAQKRNYQDKPFSLVSSGVCFLFQFSSKLLIIGIIFIKEEFHWKFLLLLAGPNPNQQPTRGGGGFQTGLSSATTVFVLIQTWSRGWRSETRRLSRLRCQPQKHRIVEAGSGRTPAKGKSFWEKHFCLQNKHGSRNVRLSLFPSKNFQSRSVSDVENVAAKFIYMYTHSCKQLPS